MSEITKLEYRVKPVTRYLITRYVENGADGAASSVRGEYDNADHAFETAYALCKVEHEHLGFDLDDMRVRYPERVEAAASESGEGRPLSEYRRYSVLDEPEPGDFILFVHQEEGRRQRSNGLDNDPYRRRLYVMTYTRGNHTFREIPIEFEAARTLASEKLTAVFDILKEEQRKAHEIANAEAYKPTVIRAA